MAITMLTLTFCTSKNQEIPKPAPLSVSQNATGQWTLTTYENVTETSPVVAAFRNSTDFTGFSTSNFGQLNFEQAHLASFAQNADFKALHVPLLTNSGATDTTRFLLAFYDKNKDSFFSMVREMKGTREADGEGNFVFTGELRYYTPDGYVVGGVIANKNKFVGSIEGNTPATGTYARYPSFNACYQHMKKQCTDDWLCDVACTFNPGCVIAYVVACIWEQNH